MVISVNSHYNEPRSRFLRYKTVSHSHEPEATTADDTWIEDITRSGPTSGLDIMQKEMGREDIAALECATALD